MNTTTEEIEAHLSRLATELRERELGAEVRTIPGRQPVLHVWNPNQRRLCETITVADDAYRWTWGQVIGPLTETPGVADRIQHVLREVSS